MNSCWRKRQMCRSATNNNNIGRIRRRTRSKRKNIAYGRCIVVKFSWKKIRPQIMCTIILRAIMPGHVMHRVRASKRAIHVRNSAIVVAIVTIDFLAAVARHSVTRNSALAIWPFVNVIRTCVTRAGRINLKWIDSHARMCAFSGDNVSYFFFLRIVSELLL